MYKVYKTGQEFLDENLDIIRNDPLGATFFEANANMIPHCDDGNYALRVEVDGELLLAIHVGKYPMVLYGSKLCVDELAEAVTKHKLSFGKTIGDLELSTAFLTAYERRVGGSHKVSKSMDVMYCKQVKRCDTTGVEQATEREIDGIVQLAVDFTLEVLNERPNQIELFDKVSSQLKNFAFIREHGEIVSVAESIDEGNGLCRISYVYTKPTYRNKGYSRKIVTFLTQRANDAGNFVYLHVDKNNPISNHLYLSIGYAYVKPRYEIDYVPATNGK